MESLDNYINENKDRFLEELFELLRIPSISADPANSADMLRTAESIRDSLLAAGAGFAEVCHTQGHPVVYGEANVDASLPTVIVYGHYDVQPPDPMDLWKSDPFDPVIRETATHPTGAIFARGSADDKGQLFMHIKALEAMMQMGTLPCNIKFMIEGEEEIGSENLGEFIRQNKERLQGDVILLSDTSIFTNDDPAITVGLRGLCYMEVEVTGPNRDLHSGVYGGAVANPANVLCEMIASLFDEENRITIPGFYDNVRELPDEERRAIARAPFDEQEYKKDLDVEALRGEKGYTPLEHTAIRPCLDVNGLWSGYTGEGAKTVLPSKAYAKISMRLVPGQDPERIATLFSDHVRALAPDCVKVKVSSLHGGEASITPTGLPAYRAAARAMEDTFGKKPIPMYSGGSIPIIALFEKELNLKSVMMGFGLDSDDIHSPNEHYGLFNFFKGIETIPLFYKHFAESLSGQTN